MDFLVAATMHASDHIHFSTKVFSNDDEAKTKMVKRLITLFGNRDKSINFSAKIVDIYKHWMNTICLGLSCLM